MPAVAARGSSCVLKDRCSVDAAGCSARRPSRDVLRPLRFTTALPQAVAAADGRLGRAEQDLTAKVAPGTSSGWGGRLRVTDLAAQLGATGRHRSSAQTPDRWTVVAKMLPQR